MDSIAAAFGRIISADDPTTIKRGREDFEEAASVTHHLSNIHHKKADIHKQIGVVFGEAHVLFAKLAKLCADVEAPGEEDYDEDDMQVLRDGARTLSEFEEVVK